MLGRRVIDNGFPREVPGNRRGGARNHLRNVVSGCAPASVVVSVAESWGADGMAILPLAEMGGGLFGIAENTRYPNRD